MKKQIVILTLISLSIIGCNQIKIESKWTNQDVIIDGHLTEWQENMIVPKNSHVGIGFMNDESHLYISLTTMDRNTIMQVLTRGFTVWVDPKGGKKQHFGIRYPMNRSMGGFRQMMQNREQNPRDYDFFIRELLTGQNEIEIIGPEKNQIARLGTFNPAGINMSMMYNEGILTYEMKIPLNRTENNMYAISAEPGKNIGVGFMTKEIDRGAMKSQRQSGGGTSGGGMPGGGMGGRGGGMSGGMGGGRGGGKSGGSMNRTVPKSMEIWMKVVLEVK